MRRFATFFLLGGSVVLLTVQPAMAHPGHPGHQFADGWWHPLLGWDHLLAMVAVGLLAARIGHRALWMLPAVFMGSMVLGGLLTGLALPAVGVEVGILASCVVFGLLLAAARPPSLTASAVLVGFFAAFHGYAHAAEMAASGTFTNYAAGFLASTLLLHIAGISAGYLLLNVPRQSAIRWTGGLITCAAALMAIASI